MEICQDCIFYKDEDSYPGTGYCELFGSYIKQDEKACEDFEEDN